MWLFKTELWKINEFEWNSFEIRGTLFKYTYPINMYFFFRDIRCTESIVNFQCQKVAPVTYFSLWQGEKNLDISGHGVFV